MSCPSPRRGATLVEAIAAVVIIGVAMPPMLWAVARAHERRAAPALEDVACWLARERLEQITSDRHSSTRGYAWLTPANYPDEPAVTGFTGFARSTSFAATDADLSSPGSAYTTATVTVQWTDGSGTARSVSLATVLTEYGP